MATSELIAPLPRLTLSNGMTIAFEAIDPATGLAVSGVKVSQVAIYGETQDAAETTVEPISVALPDSTPLWSPLPVEPT